MTKDCGLGTLAAFGHSDFWLHSSFWLRHSSFPRPHLVSASAVALMHLGLYRAQSAAVVVEMDVRMVGQERHRHGRVDDSLGDHQGGKPHAERVVVVAGVPDADPLGLPRF